MSRNPDPVGDRIKAMEMAEAGRKAMVGLPLMARLDGRAFHTYTRSLRRPYDERMVFAMIEATSALVEEFHANIGYTQSDEISLCWYIRPDEVKRQYPFDGRYQKLTSILAAHCSVVFSRLAHAYLPEKAHLIPTFDCRVWQVPSVQDAIEVFAWREGDAVKNSITMAASTYYSHRELHGKSSKDKHEMLHAKGVNWNDYPAAFRRGTYVKRVAVERELTPGEREAIPEPHRPALGTKVKRSEVQILRLEPIRRVENIEEVFFPVKREEDAA